jgi:hypothetical protein
MDPVTLGIASVAMGAGSLAVKDPKLKQALALGSLGTGGIGLASSAGLLGAAGAGSSGAAAAAGASRGVSGAVSPATGAALGAAPAAGQGANMLQNLQIANQAGGLLGSAFSPQRPTPVFQHDFPGPAASGGGFQPTAPQFQQPLPQVPASALRLRELLELERRGR